MNHPALRKPPKRAKFLFRKIYFDTCARSEVGLEWMFTWKATWCPNLILALASKCTILKCILSIHAMFVLFSLSLNKFSALLYFVIYIWAVSRQLYGSKNRFFFNSANLFCMLCILYIIYYVWIFLDFLSIGILSIFMNYFDHEGLTFGIYIYSFFFACFLT